MKKRILSAIALTMAMTLTFGMTVFAAGNSSNTTDFDGDTIVVDAVKANVVDPTGDELTTLNTEAATLATIAVTGATVKPISAGELKNAKEVAAQMAVTAKGEGATYTVLAAADVEITGFAGGYVTITLTKAVTPAKTIVMHLNAAGMWEAMDTEVSEDGKTLKAYFGDLSPIVVVEVAEKAGAPAPAPAPAPAAPAAPAESPKTGEVASVAAILALVCLVGVAVSAKKVRYNR